MEITQLSHFFGEKISSWVNPSAIAQGKLFSPLVLNSLLVRSASLRYLLIVASKILHWIFNILHLPCLIRLIKQEQLLKLNYLVPVHKVLSEL